MFFFRRCAGWYTTEGNGDNSKVESGCFAAHKMPRENGPDGVLATSAVERQAAGKVIVYPVAYVDEKMATKPLSYYISPEFVASHNKLNSSSWVATQYNNFIGSSDEVLSKYINYKGYRKAHGIGAFFLVTDFFFFFCNCHFLLKNNQKLLLLLCR